MPGEMLSSTQLDQLNHSTLNPYFLRATSFPANEDRIYMNNGGTDVALLKSGKYVYVSGFQSSSTLSVGATTLTNELSPLYIRPFVAQLDAKTGAPVAASNQLAPAIQYASTYPTISLDGKVSEVKQTLSTGVAFFRGQCIILLTRHQTDYQSINQPINK